MIQKSLFLLFLVVLSCATLEKARADVPIVSAGEPDTANLNTQPDGVLVDIYTRQLAYATEAQKFHQQILERQKIFGAANVKVERQYHEDMKKYYGYDEEKPAESASAAGLKESFGPPASP